MIDEVRIYDRALSLPEIQTQYAWFDTCWHFDKGSGATAHDSGTSGNDSTIYGATWTEGISGSALYFDGLDDYLELDRLVTV